MTDWIMINWIVIDRIGFFVSWQIGPSLDRMYCHMIDCIFDCDWTGCIVIWRIWLSYNRLGCHLTSWIFRWQFGLALDRFPYDMTCRRTESCITMHATFWCYEHSFSLHNCCTWKKALLQARKHFRCDILLTGIKDGTTFVLNRLLLQPPTPSLNAMYM